MSDKRHTFDLADGYEAVRDEAGRATGDVRPKNNGAAEMRRALVLCVDAFNDDNPATRTYWQAVKAGEDALSSTSENPQPVSRADP